MLFLFIALDTLVPVQVRQPANSPSKFHTNKFCPGIKNHDYPGDISSSIRQTPKCKNTKGKIKPQIYENQSFVATLPDQINGELCATNLELTLKFKNLSRPGCDHSLRDHPLLTFRIVVVWTHLIGPETKPASPQTFSSSESE